MRATRYEVTALLGAVCVAITSGQVMARDVPRVADEQHPAAPAELPDRTLPGDARGAEVTLPELLEGEAGRDLVEVKHVRFQGGTVFPLEDLARDLAPMVGKRVAPADIAAAVQAITQRYQAAGYPLSFAYLPSGNYVDGVVVIVLVEGFIARTEVAIDSAPVARRVERLAQKMVDERPLTRATFERYTALIERIPGAELSVRAPVPRTHSGATTLRVEERRIQRVAPTMSLDGGNDNDYQVLGSVALQSNTSQAERLTVAGLWPLEGEDRFYAIEYEQDIGDEGLRVSLAASRYDANERLDDIAFGGVALSDGEQEQRTERYRIGLEYPLWLASTGFWHVGGALTHHRQRSDLVYQQPVRTGIEQEVSYSAAELNTRYRRLGQRRLLELGAGVRQGVGLGSRVGRTRACVGVACGDWTELDVDLDFTRLSMQAAWIEALSPRWRITTRLDGFWSGDSLPSPEQGNYGAAKFGRGYGSSQGVGDRGIAGEIELRRIQPTGWSWLSQIEPYLVLDAARTRFNDSRVSHELASLALGVEISRGNTYRLRLEYARPVGERDFETNNRSHRLNVRISWDLRGR